MSEENKEGVEQKKEEGKEVVEKTTEEQLAEAKAELEKLRGKDLNFSKFKEQSEVKEKTLVEQMEKLKSQVEKDNQTKREDWRDTALSAVVRDEETKKLVLDEYALLNMPTETRDDVITRLNKAMKLAGVQLQGDVTATPFGSGREPERGKNINKEKDAALTSALFPHLVKKSDK